MATVRKLNGIDSCTKHAVFGYIRIEHESLFAKNQYALFETVPIAVSSLCALYCYLYDYFDLLHPDTQISEDKLTISMKEDCINWNYGKYIVPSLDQSIYKWYIKVNKIPLALRIGIISSPWNVHIPNETHDDFPDAGAKGYVYCPQVSVLSSHTEKVSNKGGILYGTELQQNDVICMELNLKERCTKFYINDKDQGIAHPNIEVGADIQYRLSIGLSHMFSVFASASIIQFTQQH